MTGKELDELEKLIAELRSAWDGKAVYHVSLLEAVHKTATPQLLTSLIAACRERDALLRLTDVPSGGVAKDFDVIPDLTRDTLESLIKKALLETDELRQALAQHRGEAGGEDGN